MCEPPSAMLRNKPFHGWVAYAALNVIVISQMGQNGPRIPLMVAVREWLGLESSRGFLSPICVSDSWAWSNGCLPLCVQESVFTASGA